VRGHGAHRFGAGNDLAVVPAQNVAVVDLELR